MADWTTHIKKNCAEDISRIAIGYPKERIIRIDVSKITESGNELWDAVLDNPDGEADQIRAALESILPLLPEGARHLGIIVRYYNVPQRKRIKHLRAKDEKHLMAIKALVKSVTETKPKVIRASFQCANLHETFVTPRGEDVPDPRRCSSAGCDSHSFEHFDARDIKIDQQWINIQDPIDEQNDGGQPSSIRCELLEDLCGNVFAGDRIIINGQYRSITVHKGKGMKARKDVYFDVNSLEINEREFDEVKYNDNDITEILEISKSGNLFDKIADSIAPSIITSVFGMRLLKRAIVLMLFEGVTHTGADGVVNRGHINVLVVSDPGMAKTKLLQFVSRIAPRGVLAVASTSTKVGLIAPVVRDESTGEYTIQAGAYAIASGGVLCLDEFSELSEDDCKYINEAMENGEAHINKAGINATIPTRASLLAACNPISGKFKGGNLEEQVKIPPPTLSRFDLIILMQDIIEEGMDTKLVKHITRNYSEGADMTGIIDPTILRKYISYGRKIVPKFTKGAKDIVEKYYLSIRKKQNLNVTNRQISSCLRLSEAHARMRLSETVEVEDAEAATDLFDMAINSVRSEKTEPNSKTVKKSKKDFLVSIVRECSDEKGLSKESAILDKMQEKSHDADTTRNLLDALAREGKLMNPSKGNWKVM